MEISPPKSIFRYRPLSDLAYNSRSSASVFERELDALINSYIYAPQFSSMNDPMEAFYEMGTSIPLDFQNTVRSIFGNFALASFTDSSKNILMWAYYASAFSGICLEFDSYKLNHLSQFRNERLLPVNYTDTAPPVVHFHSIGSEQELSSKIFCSKRTEWSHEREWRLLAGEPGKRHYIDTALKRIYLGPRISESHAKKICDALKNRTIEILHGKVTGYDLTFQTIQNGADRERAERVSSEKRNLSAFDLMDAMEFIRLPKEALQQKFQDLIQDPNLHEISDIFPSSEYLAIIANYKLRNGSIVYHTYKFSPDLTPI